MPDTARFHAFGFVPADVTREAHIRFGLFLLAGYTNFLGIDHNHEIAGIHVRGINGFLLAPEEVGGFNGHFTEDLVAGIDDPPFAVDLVGLGGKRFHGEKEPGR